MTKTKTKEPPKEVEFQLLTFEDEVHLDQEFPERERGGIATLVRAILYKNEHNNVLITIHKSFMARSYWVNPAVLCQQLNIHTHYYIKAWRMGDCICVKAGHEDFVNPRSWIGMTAERVLKECPDIMPDGRLPYLDIPWTDVPVTYQTVPSLAEKRMNTWILQRCNHRVEVKAYRNIMRIWLFREEKKSASRSRKH